MIEKASNKSFRSALYIVPNPDEESRKPSSSDGSGGFQTFFSTIKLVLQRAIGFLYYKRPDRAGGLYPSFDLMAMLSPKYRICNK